MPTAAKNSNPPSGERDGPSASRGVELAWSARVRRGIWDYALSMAPREGAVLGICRTSTGLSRTTYLVQRPLPPKSEDLRHTRFGDVSLTAHYWNRVLDLLATEPPGTGICVLHTHPGGDGVPIWSGVDNATDRSLSEYLYGDALLTPSAPLVSLVASRGALRGRVLTWNVRTARTSFDPITRMRTIAPDYIEARRTIDHAHPEGTEVPLCADRSIRVFGKAGQRLLADLHIAVVGNGGVGSMVAEHLSRWGVGTISLWDGDVVKDVNVNRSAIFTHSDAEQARMKVNAVADALPSFALSGFLDVRAHARDVRLSSETPALLDADVIICLVDDARPRHLLNRIAYGHYIPVIDGGNAIRSTAEDNPEADTAKVENGGIRVSTLGPGSPCLWCTGYLDSRRLSLAFRSQADIAADRARGYVEGLGPEHAPSVIPMNVLSAGLLEVRLQDLIFGLSRREVPEVYFDLLSGTLSELPRSQRIDCTQCRRWEAMGDGTELPLADR